MLYDNNRSDMRSDDYGPEPVALDIVQMAEGNYYFRSAVWTGEYLQTTLMNIRPGGDIGLEKHPDTDQMILVIEGWGLVSMGQERDRADYKKRVKSGSAIFVPAGIWHNVTNTGKRSLKLISVYAPPEHPHGTVHKTQQDAQIAEQGY